MVETAKTGATRWKATASDPADRRLARKSFCHLLTECYA